MKFSENIDVFDVTCIPMFGGGVKSPSDPIEQGGDSFRMKSEYCDFCNGFHRKVPSVCKKDKWIICCK